MPRAPSGSPARRQRDGRLRAAVGVGGLERQQHLLRVDHSTAAVGGELQDPRVHANRVLGTRLHAVAADHALPEIDVEASGYLFDPGVRVLVRDDVDAVRGTDGLAHHAGHAARRAVLAPHEAMGGAQARRLRPPLLRVLDGDRAAHSRPPERAGDVAPHVAEEVRRGQAEPREHLDQIEPLAEVHWSGVLEAGLDRGWPETGASGSDSPARTRDARNTRGSDSPARTRDARNTRGSDSPGPAGYARGGPGFIDCPTR